MQLQIQSQFIPDELDELDAGDGMEGPGLTSPLLIEQATAFIPIDESLLL
jgi:hypothetical protein